MFGFGRQHGGIRVSAVSVSAVGLVRGNNEDHLLSADDLGVYCVADGMGGGSEGEKASEIVCAEIAMLVRIQPVDFAARMEASCNAIICSNEAIWDYAQSMGFSQMGTTVALLLFDPDDGSQAVIGYVGDSRVYRIRRGEIRQLSVDHSVGAELDRRLGEGSDFASRSNPLSHVLTRAVGTGNTISPDWKRVSVEPGDRYLLCTDGVHDVVGNARLRELVADVPLEVAKAALEREIVAGGAPDNYSFILLDAEAACS